MLNFKIWLESSSYPENPNDLLKDKETPSHVKEYLLEVIEKMGGWNNLTRYEKDALYDLLKNNNYYLLFKPNVTNDRSNKGVYRNLIILYNIIKSQYYNDYVKEYPNIPIAVWYKIIYTRDLYKGLFDFFKDQKETHLVNSLALYVEEKGLLTLYIDTIDFPINNYDLGTNIESGKYDLTVICHNYDNVKYTEIKKDIKFKEIIHITFMQLNKIPTKLEFWDSSNYEITYELELEDYEGEVDWRPDSSVPEDYYAL